MVLCRGQQGTSAGEETGDDGGGSDERGQRSGTARGKWEGGKGGEKGKKARGRKPKKMGWHWRAGVVGVGRWSPVSGLHQLLSGGGSLCILFFILSRYSCWDTASTEARISSSSQSFRPVRQKGKKNGAPSACFFFALCRFLTLERSHPGPSHSYL